MKRGKIVGDEPCPQCRSQGHDSTGNHLIIFENGNKYCNRCGYKEITNKQYDKEATEQMSKYTLEEIQSLRTLDYRGVPAETWANLGVKMSTSETNRTQVEEVFYPIHNTSDQLIGYKKRTLPKTFTVVGDVSKIPKQLFGQHSIGEGGKMLVIVEGEDDVGAAKHIFSLLGKSYNVVGLGFGANFAAQQITDNITFVESFETVVLAFDQDKPGQDATKAVSEIISPGKVRIAQFSEKDACDMLHKNKEKEFLEAVWKSKTYKTKGIINPYDVKEEWMKAPARVSYPLAPCFSDISAATKGAGEGEVWIWTAGTGGGKSQIQDENIVYWASIGVPVGVIKMEHTLNTNILNILSSHLGVNLKDEELRSQVSDDTVSKEYDKLFESGNILFINHEHEDGSDSSLLDRVRQLVVGYKRKIIVIDHLNAVLYEDSDSEGDENRRTDRLLRTLAKFAAQYSVNFQLVAHPRKSTSGSKSAESGGALSLDDLKGSSGTKQIPDVVVSVIRNTQAEDESERSKADIILLKNRWFGKTGKMDSIKFDMNTATYSKVHEEY